MMKTALSRNCQLNYRSTKKLDDRPCSPLSYYLRNDNILTISHLSAHEKERDFVVSPAIDMCLHLSDCGTFLSQVMKTPG